MGTLLVAGTIPHCKINQLLVTEATNRWHQFNEDPSQPGCLVTFLGEQGDAVEYYFPDNSVHFELAADIARSHRALAFSELEPTNLMTSGRCLSPGCSDYGKRVACYEVYPSLEGE